MKKITVLILASLLLVACSKKEEVKKEETVKNQETEKTEKEETTQVSRDKSTSPNTVTDFDRSAVTALVNQELRKSFGGSVSLVKSNELNFSKNEGLITVKGNYLLQNKGASSTKGFEFRFQDKNVEYVLVSSTVKKEVEQVENANPASPKVLEGENLVKTHDLHVGTGIVFSAKHQGTGTIRATVTDASGKEIEVFRASDEFDTSMTTDLESGNYVLNIYSTGGTFSYRFSGK